MDGEAVLVDACGFEKDEEVEEEEENYIDEKSVESILDGELPSAVLIGRAETSKNPFWSDGEEDLDDHEHTPEDDTDSRPRQYSSDIKGKGRAFV